MEHTLWKMDGFEMPECFTLMFSMEIKDFVSSQSDWAASVWPVGVFYGWCSTGLQQPPLPMGLRLPPTPSKTHCESHCTLLYLSYPSCDPITHQWELIHVKQKEKKKRREKENTWAIHLWSISWGQEDGCPYVRTWLWVCKAMNICLKNYTRWYWAQGLCVFP